MALTHDRAVILSVAVAQKHAQAMILGGGRHEVVSLSSVCLVSSRTKTPGKPDPRVAR